MQATMKPAKRVKDVAGKIETVTLDKAIQYFVPSMEDVQEHLDKETSFVLSDDSEDVKYTEETGIPVYADELSAWIMAALDAKAKTKVRGAFKVEGDSADSLSLNVTGTIPATLDELLASERAGGPYMTQKAAFLKVFVPWISKTAKRPKMFISALSRASLAATNRDGWPVIEKALEAFVGTLEDESEYSVYLRAVRNQLHAEEEAEDWSEEDSFEV